MYKHDYPMYEHDFVKQNLVTIVEKRRTYDHYKCKTCGCEGKRYGLSSFVTGKVNNSLNPKPRCTKAKIIDFQQKKVLIIADTELANFGIVKGGIYETVPCPAEHTYRPDFVSSVWIFSEQRKDACRLLEHEYEFITLNTPNND